MRVLCRDETHNVAGSYSSGAVLGDKGSRAIQAGCLIGMFTVTEVLSYPPYILSPQAAVWVLPLVGAASLFSYTTISLSDRILFA